MSRRSPVAVPKQDAKTGRWGFVVDVPGDLPGQRKQVRRKGFLTKREAQEALDEVRQSVVTQTFVPASKLTVAGFLAEEWLPAKAIALQDSTHKSYTDKVRLYVEPSLGKMKLQRVTGSDLNKLYAHLLVKGSAKKGKLSPRTVRYVHTILGAAFGDAVRWGRLTRNPADAATPPRAVDAHAPEMVTWDGATVNAFLTAEKDTRYTPAFTFLVTTGTRRGEALGVRWSDLDLKAGRVSIRQTIKVVGNEIVISPRTKSAKARVIVLDRRTVAALRAWRTTQQRERLLQGAHVREDDLVFALPDGRPYHPDRFSREFIRRQERHAVGPMIRLHDLRHTWATLALLEGVHPKVVQERLGHSSIAITLDLYSHVTDPMKSDAAEQVASLIFGA
jgi:integrase